MLAWQVKGRKVLVIGGGEVSNDDYGKDEQPHISFS